MIKLYTLHKLLLPENRKKVHPLIFDLHYYEGVNNPVKNYYELLDDPSLADAFIFPIDYLAIAKKAYQNDYKKLYDLAVLHGKKLLVYTGGDYGKTFKDVSIITFRNSGFKSKMDRQTFVMPAFFDDPTQQTTVDFKLLNFNETPKISFTGFATTSLKIHAFIFAANSRNNLKRRLGKELSDVQQFYNLAKARFKILKKLDTSDKIETDFIYREKYRAGAVTAQERKKSTAEFFQNINDTPYTFCLRGAGNFSVRFYESLACGRIPVLVDTDVQLPLEEIINWDQHICRVLPHENIEEKLISFHSHHNSKSFEEIQKSNRKLYKDYLTRHAYFCKLHDILKNLF